MIRTLTFPIWFGRTTAEKTDVSPSKPKPAPVFIHDAVMPWQGETMLLKLLRDQAYRELEDE
jgi:hypothetical protein